MFCTICSMGFVLCCRKVAGLPEARDELALETVSQRHERNPGRRDGAGQNRSGHCTFLQSTRKRSLWLVATTLKLLSLPCGIFRAFAV